MGVGWGGKQHCRQCITFGAKRTTALLCTSVLGQTGLFSFSEEKKKKKREGLTKQNEKKKKKK